MTRNHFSVLLLVTKYVLQYLAPIKYQRNGGESIRHLNLDLYYVCSLYVRAAFLLFFPSLIVPNIYAYYFNDWYHFFFVFLGLQPWHTEVPRLGVESEL